MKLSSLDSMKTLAAKLIAEGSPSQVDEEGRPFQILGDVIDHRKNGYILSKDECFVTDKQGQRHPTTTTHG